MEIIKARKNPIIVSVFKFDSKEIRKDVEKSLNLQLEELIDNTNWLSLNQFFSINIHINGIHIKCFIILKKLSDVEYLEKIDITKQIITYSIETLEGEMIISDGDYVITGVNGGHYPCKPDIFNKTYDILDD